MLRLRADRISVRPTGAAEKPGVGVREGVRFHGWWRGQQVQQAAKKWRGARLQKGGRDARLGRVGSRAGPIAGQRALRRAARWNWKTRYVRVQRPAAWFRDQLRNGQK